MSHPDIAGGLSATDLAADRLLLVPEQTMLRDGPVSDHAVVVAHGAFHAVGPAPEVLARYPDLAPLPLPRTLLMPGFIDAHHHLSQTFGKALAFGEPSEIFRRIWVPLEGSMDADMVYLAAKLGALEALRGGFTTVVDAGTRSAGDVAAIASATTETGLRCVLGAICNDLGGGGPGSGSAAILAAADRHLARWEGDALVHPSLAVSIPEAASDTMLRAVSARCAEAGAIFQTHANEHLVAVERSLVARGFRPIQLLNHLGALGPQVLLAHATLLTPNELAMLRRSNTAIAYNPVATQWKGNAAAPAELMATLGIRFGIGTDGTRADGFRMVDAAEATQRLCFGLAVGDFSCGGGWLWLDHALADGAEAVGLGARTGRIEAGYAADFLLVDLDVPEMLPSWDLTWELVRLANRDQIAAVFVAGRLRLWRGWPVDWDARALLRRVAELAEAVLAQAPIQRIHAVSAAHRAGNRA
jgi:cytosine/adenosine deaminase-related metal-dependent hydrolase